MLRAVLFDLDNTLYDTGRQVALARENAVKAMIAAGLEADYEEAAAALADVVSERGPNYGRHYDDMMARLGLKPDPKAIAAGVAAYHDAKTAYLVPYPDTVPTLLEIRDRGYRIGVVTDGVPVKQWEKLIRLGLSDFFHAVTVTDEESAQKPNPKSFRNAAAALKVKPGECMMVGDRLDRDVRGAKAAGMTAVQLAADGRLREPVDEGEEPDYIISRLSDLLELLD